MKKSIKQVLLGTVVAMLPMFGACERVDQISSVETTDFAAAPGKSKKVKVVTANSTASGVVYGYATQGKGTTLDMGNGYRLDVPRGAVKHPTVFVMKVTPGDRVAVSLEAWSGNDKITTFRVPLKLTMPLSALSAEDLENTQKLLIANVAEDGSETILDVTNAQVDASKTTIAGFITHFSTWVVAKDYGILID